MNDKKNVKVAGTLFRHMNQMLACFVALCVLFGCNESGNNTGTIEPDTTTTDQTNNKSKDAQQDDKNDNKKVGNTQKISGNCYALDKNGSTAYLQLNINNESVTGNLKYRFKEKDSNDGTIKGYIKGDKLYTFYTFQSEGMTSVREEIFKMEGDRLLIAIGDLDMRNDTVFFKSKDNLRYNEAFPLTKTSCK